MNEKATYATYSSTVLSYNASLLETKNVEITDFTSVVTCNLSLTSSVIITAPEVSNKSIILFEKNGDDLLTETLNFYWDFYPDLFERIQIVYTDIDENGNPVTTNDEIVKNNIKFLNEYYNKGYRLFIGFSRSSILRRILPWFETIGTEAKGISFDSGSSTLNFPKSVYRLLANSLTYTTSIIDNADKLYYIYSEGETVSESNLYNYEQDYPDKLIALAIKPDSSNLTLEIIQDLYKNVNSNCVTFFSLILDDETLNFLNLFSLEYPMPTHTYDISSTNFPEISESAKNGIIDKFTIAKLLSFSSSILYREGYNKVGENFQESVLNGLFLINTISLDENVDSLSSYNAILEFNENSDMKYYTILLSTYSKNDKGEFYFKDYAYYVYDPIIGKQLFII